MHEAAKGGHLPVVQELMSAGAHIKTKGRGAHCCMMLPVEG